jgi:hypothetical protein
MNRSSLQHYRCPVDLQPLRIENAVERDDTIESADLVSSTGCRYRVGGFNQFSDPGRAATESARVVKLGGIVLYADESVAPWLRGTELDRIVCANNPRFAHALPLHTIPTCARDVTVHWVLANCFYVIVFRKGEGPPPLNLDLPHKGWRGGTMRSRYFGVLEGVTPEAKQLAQEAAARRGLSVHSWLDQLVRRQAAQDLGDEPGP